MEQLLVFSTQEILILTVIIILFLIELLYYMKVYHRPYRMQRKKIKEGEGYYPEQLPSVSVIVYAKNESVNLRNHLPAILNQNYPAYEVIVINDGSTDESEDVLKIYENQYSHLYHTFIPQESKYLSRKKLSLTMGIKAAKNDILLFTEANCQPLSNKWIESMVREYTSGTKIILGFSAYRNTNGFFHSLVAYDNLINGLRYISSALVKQPYAGNGRNLSYRKELFFEHKGYSSSLALHAGDDDLFINQLADGDNTKVVYTPDSITDAELPDYFNVWREMKTSRAATERYYKGKQLLFYRTETFCFFLFLIAVLTAIIMGLIGNPLVTLTGILLYLALYMVKANVIEKASDMLKQKSSVLLLPLFEIILPVFGMYVKIYRTFRGKNDYTFHMKGK